MADSLIPADHETRVLLTIKNGQVTKELLIAENMYFGTIESLIQLLAESGKLQELVKAYRE